MVENKVKSIIAKHLGKPDSHINLHQNIVEDLGADSLDMVELVMRMEDEWGIIVRDEEAEKMKTVQDVVNFVLLKSAGNQR